LFWWRPGFITGKPLALGGSQGRSDATARGGIYTVREAAKHLQLDLSKSTYAVQGFGNAGQNAATLHKKILGGGRLLAVSDSSGGVWNEDGINPEAILKYKLETGKVSGLPGTKPISNEALLELKVDVLYPAALENVITEKNANNIKAKIVCELANGPTTPEADRILHSNNVFVIPDFLANAGGVTVSYFEQVQNAYNHYWTLDEVYSKLDQKMTTAFDAVLQTQKRYKVHNRLAAYLLAVQRVAEACKLRGWV
jgi:glutamate dehydrogenase (NAD(P)+)